jgi:hypothetical protein
MADPGNSPGALGRGNPCVSASFSGASSRRPGRAVLFFLGAGLRVAAVGAVTTVPALYTHQPTRSVRHLELREIPQRVAVVPELLLEHRVDALP